MKLTALTAATTAAILLGSTAFAQTAFDGANQATDRNENLRDAINDDLETDTTTFGNAGRKIGFSGSVALRGSVANGNTDAADLGIGADMLYFDGTNGYSLELSYDYGEEAGTKTEESLFFDAEYTRDFNPNFYGFAKLQGSVDEFSSYDSDYFVGIGAGYRVLNSDDVSWTVQGGPGYRVASLTDIVDGETEEAAFSASSNFSYKLSDIAYLTNDTDVLTSESDTGVVNELGVTVAMSEVLALRTTLQTKYHTDPQVGYDNTDNTFGVSLVFNY
ncbi:MAG: putative salt-induced outer membrane protein [Celeribacter sp.]|jgi:putative salt-induced outer membrane protein